jgi:hypothetical protein
MEGQQRKYLFPHVSISVLSVTARNELVDKEVNISYRGHMLYQAGYQGSSVLVAA